MIIRRCDRYLLREMIGPFVISLGGLLLFIMMNLILSLSDLMVARGVGIMTLAQLILLKMPHLMVLALPASALFATFIGLGRLMHDREVMALEAAGISLRRILAPLLAAAVLVAGGTFALYNWGVPHSEHAYQKVLREIIFRHGVPTIHANIFFRGPQGQFFYVRRYDAEEGILHGVIVYDVEGELFPLAEAEVTILTAAEGRWEEDLWTLHDGKVYGFDRDGVLIHTGNFVRLDVAAGRVGSDFLFGSRTPAAMGIGELNERIAVLRRSGHAVDDLIVERHLRMAIPVATLVFVLFGGSVSLLFGGRSRAVGVVIGLLLVGLFQGILLGTQTLGRQGVIPPLLGAWAPNILVGLIGLALFLCLDRLSRQDLWAWVRRLFPFLAIMIVTCLPLHGEEVPVRIESETLFVSADRRDVLAEGDVLITSGETILMADRITLNQDDEGVWQLHAAGRVRLEAGDELTLSGSELSSTLSHEAGGMMMREVTASHFRGTSRFVNPHGEVHLLHYRGENGWIQFDQDGEIDRIEVTGVEFTTCDCGTGPIRAQPYSLEAERLLIYPDRLIVAFNLTVRSFGLPVFWLPVYVQPLEETIENPLFPSIGQSALRGWFFKWNIPFYLAEGNYGTIIFDYFSRFHEVGLGVIFHYTLAGERGIMRAYHLPARIGNSVTEFSLEQTLVIADRWNAAGSLAYTAIGEDQNLTFASSITGEIEDWRVALAAGRTRSEDDKVVKINERLPELSLSRSPITFGDLSLIPRLSAGWHREWTDGTLTGQSFRLDGALAASLSPLEFAGFTLVPTAGLRLTRYTREGVSHSREARSFALTLSHPGMTLTYTYREVTGRSPFAFDRLVAANHLAWRFTSKAGIAVHVAGGINLEKGKFDPLRLTANWTLGAAFTLAAEYDLARAAPVRIALSGRLADETAELSWTIPYDAVRRRFDLATVKAQIRGETGSISIQGTIDPTLTQPAGFSLQAEFHLEPGWGISLGGRYEPKTGTIRDTSFGLFRDLHDCLRIGIEQRAGQIWLYISILAFPDAILRYAPVGARFKVGD